MLRCQCLLHAQMLHRASKTAFLLSVRFCKWRRWKSRTSLSNFSTCSKHNWRRLMRIRAVSHPRKTTNTDRVWVAFEPAAAAISLAESSLLSAAVFTASSKNFYNCSKCSKFNLLSHLTSSKNPSRNKTTFHKNKKSIKIILLLSKKRVKIKKRGKLTRLFFLPPRKIHGQNSHYFFVQHSNYL